MKISTFIIVLTILVEVTHCCKEIPEIKTTVATLSPWVEEEVNEDEYNYEDSPDIPRKQSTIIETTLYSRIICSNLASFDQIPHDYEQKSFDQYLIIKDSNITILKPAAFLQFDTIAKLFLSQIHLNTILPGAFNGLTRLRELHLDHNELTDLSKGVYNSLHRLEILNLANNRIHQVENRALTGLNNLMNLYLKNNNLSVIEEEFLNGQEHLKNLDVSGNPLKEISLDGLNNLNSLKVASTFLIQFDTDLSNLTMALIDLSESKLSIVDFSKFPRVNRVDLSKNQIYSLDNCENLDAISVNLSHNKITEMNGTFSGISELNLGHNSLEMLHDSFFDNSKGILTLDFSFNKLSIIEKSVFRGLTSLNRLFLQHNNISKINVALFQDLRALAFLNLSHNRIEEFQFGIFDNLYSLETLDISSNRLVDLHVDTFHSLKGLRNLHFDNNRISSFNINSLKNYCVNLRIISLDYNLWTCQDLVNMNQYLRSSPTFIAEGNTYTIDNFRGIACRNEKKIVSKISDNSVQNFAKNFQKVIDQGVKNSKMERFFNEDFKNTKFSQYFDKDYAQSNFFKFLDNYKFIVTKQESNGTKMEKLTSLQAVPNEYNDRILVFSAVAQVLIVILLGCGILLIFNFLKKINKSNQKATLSSQIELC